MKLLWIVLFFMAPATLKATPPCHVVHQVIDAEEWRDVKAYMDQILQKQYVVTDYCRVWHQDLFIDDENTLVRCDFPPSGLQYFFGRREEEDRIVVSFPARYTTSFVDEVFGC